MVWSCLLVRQKKTGHIVRDERLDTPLKQVQAPSIFREQTLRRRSYTKRQTGIPELLLLAKTPFSALRAGCWARRIYGTPIGLNDQLCIAESMLASICFNGVAVAV